MTMAIDRESITTDVLKDGSLPTYTAVPMQFAAGPDGSDFSEDQEKFSDVCTYDAEKAADYWVKGIEIFVSIENTKFLKSFYTGCTVLFI